MSGMDTMIYGVGIGPGPGLGLGRQDEGIGGLEIAIAALPLNKEITRRDFNKLVGIGAAVTALGGCASIDIGRAQELILFDYNQHDRPPRGIDTQRGYGVQLTSPGFFDVWASGKHPFATGSTIVFQSKFGHIINLSGESNIDVQPNDETDPLKKVGNEGLDAPHATKPHTHEDVRVPPFAKLFNKYETYTDTYTGTRYLLDNPHLQSVSGNLATSIYKGENGSGITQLVKKGEERLNAIGKQYPENFVGWFINNSQDSRLATRAITVSKLREYGFTRDNPQLDKAILNYLKWHSEIKAGIFLHYENPELKGRYQKPKSSPGKKEKIQAVWNNVVENFNQWNRKGLLLALEEFKEISPLWGEANLERNFGIAYRRLEQPKNAAVHSLIADAITEYFWEWGTDKKIKTDFYKGIYRPLVIALRDLTMFREARVFGERLKNL